jgi:hypothetical protein
MASYTMTLRDYVEEVTQDTLVTNERDRIEAGRSKLFDFDYPIFDVNYKQTFETHFIRHFYMREIGFETEGLFKFYLETWLSIHMPYWNKVFQSELIDFDPLSNTKLNVTQHKTGNKTNQQDSTLHGSDNGSTTGSNSGTLSENDFNRELESTNPDSRLSITSNNGEGVIEYASGIKENSNTNSKTSSSNQNQTTNNTSDVTSSASGSNTDTVDATDVREGKTGDITFSEMLNEYRDSFLRVEKQTFHEMQELFMLVY